MTKRYEVEVLEERVGRAQRLADAIHAVFDACVTDIIDGPNGNPLLIVEVPENWAREHSFKLWLIEGPGLSVEAKDVLDPLLEEADKIYAVSQEQYYLMVRR